MNNWIRQMQKTFMSVILWMAAASAAQADPVGELMDKIVQLDGSKFEQFEGFLFQNWLQMDENDIKYVVYIGNRQYSVRLDDGRSTSERASSCPKANFFDENPATGCPIIFDGEYIVEDGSGSLEVSTVIWDVEFR